MRFLALLLLLFGLNAQATTPVLSDVTCGSITDGASCTITGTTMMDENITTMVAPFSSSAQTMYKMNGASMTADGWAGTCGANCAYSTDQNLMYANKSIRSQWSGASTGPPSGQLSAESYWQTSAATTGSWFWRMYLLSDTLSGVWPDEDLKMLAMYGAVTSANNCFFNLNNNLVNGSHAPDSFGAECNSSFTNGNLPGGRWPELTWNLLEGEMKCSSGSGANGTKVWYKNQLIISITSPGNTCYSGSGFPSPSIFTNAWSTSSGFSQKLYIDGFAFATSRIGPASLIEVTTGSTYAATSYGAGTRVYQDPTSLSDTSNGFTLKLPASCTGGCYVWVTNQRGELSNGLLLGGSPPAAPTYLPIKL